MGRIEYGGHPVFFNQMQKTLPSQLTGGDHGLDITGVHLRRADVIQKELPQVVVADPFAVQLNAVKQAGLGPDIDHINVEARRSTAHIEQVGGDRGKTDQLALPEDGNGNTQVRGMAGALEGMVM